MWHKNITLRKQSYYCSLSFILFIFGHVRTFVNYFIKNVNKTLHLTFVGEWRRVSWRQFVVLPPRQVDTSVCRSRRGWKTYLQSTCQKIPSTAWWVDIWSSKEPKNEELFRQVQKDAIPCTLKHKAHYRRVLDILLLRLNLSCRVSEKVKKDHSCVTFRIISSYGTYCIFWNSGIQMPTAFRRIYAWG